MEPGCCWAFLMGIVCAKHGVVQIRDSKANLGGYGYGGSALEWI